MQIPGSNLTIPANEIGRRDSDARAWLNGIWRTVRLHGPTPAIRVHAGAGEGAASARNVHLVAGSGPSGKGGLAGTWYAIGDFIQPYDEYIRSRALPQTKTRFGPRSLFTHAMLVTFHPGTVLNVGTAAPLFGHPGGGGQAQFLEGPTPIVKPLSGVWGNQYGRA